MRERVKMLSVAMRMDKASHIITYMILFSTLTRNSHNCYVIVTFLTAPKSITFIIQKKWCINNYDKQYICYRRLWNNWNSLSYTTKVQRVENIRVKGEFDCFQQISPYTFCQCFRNCSAGCCRHVKMHLQVWEGSLSGHWLCLSKHKPLSINYNPSANCLNQNKTVQYQYISV